MSRTWGSQNSGRLDKACIFATGGLLKGLTEEFLVKAMVKQVMTGFGGKYKKMDGFRDEGKISATLTTKQGKEDAELYFSKVGKMLSLKPMSLAKVSVAWNSTSWLWGVRPSFYTVTQTPNGAAYFKMVCLGEIEAWVVDTMSITAAAKTLDMKYTGLEGLIKLIEELTPDDFRKLKGAGAQFLYKRLRREDMIYVPMGAIILEKSSDASLIYGIRKSFMFDSPSNKLVFNELMTMMKASGANITKMGQVADLFS